MSFIKMTHSNIGKCLGQDSRHALWNIAMLKNVMQSFVVSIVVVEISKEVVSLFAQFF